MLLVSSASKIALKGSTVTVFEMGPVVGGATSTIVIVLVDSAGIAPLEQVRTLAPSTLQPPEKSGALKLSRTVPGGRGSRTTTPVAPLIPLLPTTNV